MAARRAAPNSENVDDRFHDENLNFSNIMVFLFWNDTLNRIAGTNALLSDFDVKESAGENS
jgi:hypothetical protein